MFRQLFKGKMTKAATSLLMAFIFTVSSVGVIRVQAETAPLVPAEYTRVTPTRHTLRYLAYMQLHEGAVFTGNTITLRPADLYSHTDTVVVEQFAGRQAIVSEEIGYKTFLVDVPEAAWYAIEIDYFPIVEHERADGTVIRGTGGPIQRAVFINGVIPFDEAWAMELTRIFVDVIETDRYGEPIPISGNHLRPRQDERPRWNTEALRDPFGYYGRAIYFFLEAGVQQITFRSLSEPVAISEIRLISESFAAISYADYIAMHEARGTIRPSGVLEGGILTIAGETPYEKGDPTLFAFNDTFSTQTYPHDARVRRMNAIGGHMWSTPNQWITWQVYAPVAGLFNIDLRVRQSFSRDINANRTILINGELPFAEAAYIEFPYGRRHNGWFTTTVSDAYDNPFYFFFEAGWNTLTFKNTAGAMTDILMRAQYVMDNLQEINLEIMSFMGPSPDEFRDWHLLRRMPHVFHPVDGSLAYNAQILREIHEEMLEHNGGSRDSLTSQLQRLIRSVEMLYHEPERVARNIGMFRVQLPGLGNWMQMIRQQALSIDRIFISETGVDVRIREDNLWDRFWFTLVEFINSFFTNFSQIGDRDLFIDGNYITVWIGGVTGGRDQAMALNSMVERDFTAVYGIPVNLQLVGTGVVLIATLAGRGPDVTLSVTAPEPVDFALRNAVVNLRIFDDFDEVAARFFPAALTTFELYWEDGTGIPHVYALPETVIWPMMFYRIDVLQELGIDPYYDLRSWQSILELYPRLLAQSMEFGLPANVNMFVSFLYQMGGELFTENFDAVNLDDPLSLEAFRFFTAFFLEAGMARDFDFINRFRSGEMPIAIASYFGYNHLSIFAPELRGRWNMVPIPGFERPCPSGALNPDGSPVMIIDNTVAPANAGMGGPAGSVGPGATTAVGGTFMMQVAVTRNLYNEAWNFMKWWTGADAQHNFGRQLESVMGQAARHPTANIEAFERMPWPAEIRQNLMAQAANMRGIEQLPGGYYVPRHFAFAINDVLNEGVHERQDPRQRLLRASNYINAEITRRRIEFGLSVRD